MKELSHHYGKLRASLAPTEHAIRDDIIWAAGIFEGDGYCQAKTGRSTQVTVVQKDDWLPTRLRALFGGSVARYDYTGYLAHNPCYRWTLYGARARGFLMSVYGLLSPRRQAQAKIALQV